MGGWAGDDTTMAAALHNDTIRIDEPRCNDFLQSFVAVLDIHLYAWPNLCTCCVQVSVTSAPTQSDFHEA